MTRQQFAKLVEITEQEGEFDPNDFVVLHSSPLIFGTWETDPPAGTPLAYRPDSELIDERTNTAC